MRYQNRNCICCESDQLETLYEISNVQVLLKEAGASLVTTVQVCPKCGMVMLNPIADDSFYETYYQNSLRVTADNEGASRQEKRKEQHEFCQSCIPDYERGGRVYDIGAHDGSLLSFFKADCWQVSGCDLSVKGNSFARKNYGIELDLSDFLQCNQPEDSFEVVTIFQVLEHIIDPKSLLLKVRKMLKEKGVFILEIPNLDKPSSQNLANYFDFEHVNYFEVGSITNLLAAIGFSVEESTICQRNKALRIVARKGPANVTPQNHYSENRQRVLDYETQYTNIIRQIEKRLTPYLSREIVLYGAGQHTEQLLREVTIARQLDIKAVVDTSSQKWGKDILGFNIKPPQWLENMEDCVVVISSFSFASAIKNTIREINPLIKIVGLYDE